MENYTISVVHQLTGLFLAMIPRSLGNDFDHSVTPLAREVTSFIVRENNNDPKLVSVFDSAGAKVFSIEQTGSMSKRWHIYSEPQREKMADVTIGLFKRYVNSPNEKKTDLRLDSGVLGKLHRHFYDANGKLYSWNRRSHYLEEISNPQGGHEEHRKRIAFISRLRENRFDWELLVDTQNIDVIKALTTAFITVKTQWPVLRTGAVIPGDRYSGFVAAAASNGPEPQRQSDRDHDPEFQIPEATFENNSVDGLRIFKRRSESPNPREFFNPPKFLEQKLLFIA